VERHWESGSSYGHKDIPTSCDVAIVSTSHGAHPTHVIRDLKKVGMPFVLANFSYTAPWVGLLNKILPPVEDQDEVEEAPARVEALEGEEEIGEALSEKSIWEGRMVPVEKATYIMAGDLREGDTLVLGSSGDRLGHVAAVGGGSDNVEILTVAPSGEEHLMSIPAALHIKAVPCQHEPAAEVVWNDKFIITTCIFCGVPGKAAKPAVTWDARSNGS